MKRLPLLLVALALASCSLIPKPEVSREGRRLRSDKPNRGTLLRTEWGTWRLRGTEVWWACKSRYERCSPTDSWHTLMQMDTTAAANRRELCRAEGDAGFNGRDLAPLRDAVARASAARALLRDDSMWGDVMADYVQACVDGERAVGKLAGRRARSWPPREARRTARAAQRECSP